MVKILKLEENDPVILQDILQFVTLVAHTADFSEYIKKNQLESLFIDLIHNKVYQDQLAEYYCQIIFKMLVDQKFLERYKNSKAFDQLWNKVDTQNAFLRRLILNILIQITSKSVIEVNRNLLAKILNDLKPQADVGCLQRSLQVIVNLSKQQAYTILFTSVYKNTFFDKLARIAQETQQERVFSEVLNVLWNLMLITDVQVIEESMGDQLIKRCFLDPDRFRAEITAMTSNLLNRHILKHKNLPLKLDFITSFIRRFSEENNQAYLHLELKLLRPFIGNIMNQDDSNMLKPFINHAFIKKCMNLTKSEDKISAVSSVKILGMLCISTSFQTEALKLGLLYLYLDLIQSLKTDIDVAKPALHALEIFLIEQSQKLDKLMLFEICKSFFLVSAKGDDSLKREALVILNNINMYPNVKAIFFQTDFFEFIRIEITREKFEEILFLIKSGQISDYQIETHPTLREEIDKEPITSLADEMVEMELRNKIRAGGNITPEYSFEDLKDFKDALEQKKLDVEKKEKELAEKEKTISKVVSNSKRINSEMESFKIEKEILIKEKKNLQEEFESTKSYCTQLKIEREELEKRTKWLENVLETRSGDFETIRKKEDEYKRAKDSLSRIQSEIESMRFKYNDYDRLVRELLNAHEHERAIQTKLDSIEAYSKSLEEKLNEYVKASMSQSLASINQSTKFSNSKQLNTSSGNPQLEELSLLNASLAETNRYYKDRVQKLEQEFQLKANNEEHFRQKITILEAELKRLRESELALRLFAEQAKATQLKKPQQIMSQDQADEAIKKISVDILNDFALKNEIIKKECEMERLENNYLKSQNHEMMAENQQLQQEIKSLNEKVASFHELIDNMPKGSDATETNVRDYLLYLQNALTEYKRKYGEMATELRQREDIINEEREKYKRVKNQLKEYIDKEATLSSKYLSAQKELKALTMMLTSEESKDVLSDIKRDYEKEIIGMNDIINKQGFEISELRFLVDYYEKRLFDKISIAFYDQEFSKSQTETIDDKMKSFVEKLIKRCEHLEARYNFYKELVEQKEFLNQKSISDFA